MYINLNGEILDHSEVCFRTDNRAFKYGDGVFETMKFTLSKINFWEDHYFRLMAGMRILRMEIPMSFSPEYLEKQMIETIEANHFERNACAIRLMVYRKAGGKYTPETNDVEWVIEVNQLPEEDYSLNKEGLNVDVFKDHYKPKGLLSNIKSTNCLLYTIAGIYAQENNLDDVLLVNDDKQVVEATSSNVFIIKENKLITPPVSSGCLKGVIRKNIIELAPKIGLEIEEKSFSPFELQRVDEAFLTNAISGIQWIAKFKKKSLKNEKTIKLLELLNQSVH